MFYKLNDNRAFIFKLRFYDFNKLYLHFNQQSMNILEPNLEEIYETEFLFI